jgi:hypothetical protein
MVFSDYVCTKLTVWILIILTEVFCGFHQGLHTNATLNLKIGHNCLFPNHYPLTILFNALLLLHLKQHLEII